MKCDSCGAPVENGKCTYCGKVFGNGEGKSQFNDNRAGAQVDTKPKIKILSWIISAFIMIICLFMPYIGVFLLWIAKKPLNIKARIIITILLVIYSISIFSKIHDINEAQEENTSAWLDDYTDINDFYYIDRNVYNVVSLDGETGYLL